MTPLDVLIAARERIDTPEKWGKGMRGAPPTYRSQSTCCAAEAIGEASCDGVSLYDGLRIDALDAFTKSTGLPGRQILDWNDAPERTHADVLAAFDRAIEQMKGAA